MAWGAIGARAVVAGIAAIGVLGAAVAPPQGTGAADEAGPPACTHTAADVGPGGVLVGTDGDDVLCVGDGVLVVLGLAGDDIVRGDDGHTVVHAGDGDDLVDHGGGNDRVIGGDGHDVCTEAPTTNCEEVLRPNELGPEVTLLRVEEAVEAAEVDPEGTSTLLLAAATEVAVGDFLASGPTDLLPFGLLVRVIAVDVRADGVVVTTVPASLPEVIPYGDVEVSVPVQSSDEAAPVALAAADGPAMTAAAANIGEFSCSVGAPVSLSADWGVTADIEMAAVWTPWDGTDAFYDAEGSLDAAATASLSGKVACDFAAHVDGPSLPSVVFSVGVVPVVLTPELDLTLSGNVTAETSVVARAEAHAGIDAAASYVDGRFTHGVFADRSFDADLQVTAEANARLDAVATLSLQAYGAAGPAVSAGPFLEGRLAPLDDPWLTVDAGLTGQLDIIFDFFGIDERLTLAEFELWRTRLVERSGAWPGPAVTTTTAPAGTVGTPYELALAAEGGRTPLTWAVSAGSLPDGLALDADGRLHGTPTTAGARAFTVAATDADAWTDTTPLTITIHGSGGGGGISVDALAAGSGHTCAVHDGAVTCWGNNTYGQLGDGTSWVEGTSDTVRSTPVQVVGIDDAHAIAAGHDHTCALHATGSISCWGTNGFGELGDGTSHAEGTGSEVRSAPVQVLGIDDAVAVTAGRHHTCAVHATGAISCWGHGDNGQLGDGSFYDWPGERVVASTPVQVLGIDDAEGVQAGTWHTCALHATGAVSCWGWNHHGQIGDGTSYIEGTSPKARPTPVQVVGIDDAEDVQSGYLHTCALHATGGISCWGSNEMGELGDGTDHWYTATSPEGRSTPVPVVGIEDATGVSAGWRHTCATRAAGTVNCWGSNTYGQLGDGTSEWEGTSPYVKSTPVQVVGIDDALAATAGGEHSCTLHAAGGISCWGDNGYGQVGDGTSFFNAGTSPHGRSTPVKVIGFG